MQHYQTGEAILKGVSEMIADASKKRMFAEGEKVGVDYMIQLAELHFTAARTFAALGKS